MQFDSNTDRKPITVQGIVLQAIFPYTEGHELNSNEAAVLNQTLVENLRNNFANEVNEAIEKAGGKDEIDQAALQASFDKYMEVYEFGVRRGGGFVGDPVAREARAIALDTAKGLLKAKGHKLADVDKATMNALIEKVLAKKPEIFKLAQRRVEEKASIASASDLLDE